MERVAFRVEGDPVPWERVQSRRGQRFTAPRTRDYQKQVRLAAASAEVKPLVGPLRVRLSFHRKTKRRCDWDNLAKTICDALNGIAWKDDAQIVEASVWKVLDREEPRTEVEIEPLSDEGIKALRETRQRAAAAEMKRLQLPRTRRAVHDYREPLPCEPQHIGVGSCLVGHPGDE